MSRRAAMRSLPVVPKRVCILRLSALGDCANIVPVVHTLRAARPDIEIVWVINRGEARWISGLANVECVLFDKKGGRGAIRDLKTRLAGRRFDALLNMHASWRANRISRLIQADRRIGFDRRRARDGQRWFVDERIPTVESRHVVDGFLAFAAAIGAVDPVYNWRVPIAHGERDKACRLLDTEHDARPILFVSPCSSHDKRNWQAARYAAAADYAVSRHGMRCVLVGGPSSVERAMGQAIAQSMTSETPVDLIGQTDLKTLAALFEHGRLLLTPDSGPAHMANASEITTITLHGATDPRRSGAYRSRAYGVDYFAEAARRYRHSDPDRLKWGTRIEDDAHVMALIPVSAVTDRIDQAIARTYDDRP